MHTKNRGIPKVLQQLGNVATASGEKYVITESTSFFKFFTRKISINDFKLWLKRQDAAKSAVVENQDRVTLSKGTTFSFLSAGLKLEVTNYNHADADDINAAANKKVNNFITDATMTASYHESNVGTKYKDNTPGSGFCGFGYHKPTH